MQSLFADLHARIRFDLVESGWILLDLFGPRWIRLNQIESVSDEVTVDWIRLDQVGSIWIRFDPIGPLWIRLNQVRSG